MIIHDLDQGTDEWHKLRAGLPTASEASNMITALGKPSKSLQGYAERLAGDLFAGRPLNLWEGNKFTERGHELEDDARLVYEFMMDTDVEQVGFVSEDGGRCGCSPDGMVGDGLLEIKCLPRKHISAILYWKANGKIIPDYIPQVHMQMLVTGRPWCDVMFYQPALPVVIARVDADPKFQASLSEQIDACIDLRDKTLQALKEF